MTLLKDDDRLDRHLKLRDVFAISTGAMFSSGFFLLPGLAAAESGPSVVLAYLAAGLLVLPAMFSKAELSTAMPRAGGTYYFLDRSLGPLVGTVGGLGIWFALVLKSAFALIGIGAYLGLVMDVAIRPVAIALTLAFGALNIAGVKGTTRLQQVLVYILLAVLGFFTAQGLAEIANLGVGNVLERQFRPFFAFGFDGFASTVGLVFVSYAGLTKVASVAEEVDDPDRNIPRGMLLSLVTATVLYVVGVFIMVGVLDPVELRSDLTPVATAAQSFFDWLPHPAGLGLVLAAAFAAFASTGNAGILSASRYPLAMARDGLVSATFAKVGRRGTPAWSVVLTTGAMLAVLLLDVRSIAKLASAFQLLIFALINVSVIVMRESRLPSYVPGYASPLYPWMQVAGVLIPLWLVWELGALSVLFTLGVAAGGVGWYFSYASGRVTREGAIYHVFERLGRRRYEGLEPELRGILKEKALGVSAPFEEAVAGSITVELGDQVQTFEEAASAASERLAELVPTPPEDLLAAFLEETRLGMTPVAGGAALPHLRLEGVSESHLLMARTRRGIAMGPTVHLGGAKGVARSGRRDGRVHAIFFLVSPHSAPSTHLHILANIASHVERTDFLTTWLAADSADELKQVLLHEERFLTVRVGDTEATAALRDRPVSDLGLPRGVLLVLIERRRTGIVPRADSVVREGDHLTFLGEVDLMRDLRRLFAH